MTCGCGVEAHSDSADRQVHLVMDHDKIFEKNVAFLHHWSDSDAGTVHERLRLHQDYPDGFRLVTESQVDGCPVRKSIVVELVNLERMCDSVEGHEAHVMSCLIVFGTRVSQSCDHNRFHRWYTTREGPDFKL